MSKQSNYSCVHSIMKHCCELNQRRSLNQGKITPEGVGCYFAAQPWWHFLATLSRPRLLPIGNSYKLLQTLPFLETAQLRGMLAKPPGDGFEELQRTKCQWHHGSKTLLTAAKNTESFFQCRVEETTYVWKEQRKSWSFQELKEESFWLEEQLNPIRAQTNKPQRISNKKDCNVSRTLSHSHSCQTPNVFDSKFVSN